MKSQLTRCCFAFIAIALITANTAFSKETIDTPQSWTGTLDVGAAKLVERLEQTPA